MEQERFIGPNVEFLGEQDGVPECELKCKLCDLFKNTSAIRRAYLAVVKYSGGRTENIALCLVAPSETHSKIVQDAGSIFSAMFNSKEHLDIMFLKESQEKRLLQVCRPFFVRDPGSADFFMTFMDEESGVTAGGRAVWKLKPLRMRSGDNLLLVKVSPAIIYGKAQLAQVILAARRVGFSVNSINEWPFFVHVAKLNRTDIPTNGMLGSKDVTSIAWAEL